MGAARGRVAGRGRACTGTGPGTAAAAGPAPGDGPGTRPTGAELVVADDVSSALDVRTEIELWTALRGRGSTVVGAGTKRAALARADRVVVLDQGRVADEGPWSDLAQRWSHLAG